MARSHERPIFLIGYRGTGKSTVTRELAARLGCEWVDADEMLEQRVGKSITAIFADEGEGWFRDIESEVLLELCERAAIVAALGGGVVLRDENRAAIRSSSGAVVWLTASVDTILERIAADAATASRRPCLTKGGGRSEVESLLAIRTPLYRECATLVVDTVGKTAAQLADEIVASL